MTDRETLLAELPGTSETERVLLVHKFDQATHESRLELRQQSWAPRIGWFTQSSVFLTPEQAGSLRMTLGTRGGSTSQPTVAMGRASAKPRRNQAGGTPSFVPRIVRAETA
jgi:hypothetical protein